MAGLLAAVVLFMQPPAFSQTVTGSISGTVRDTSGAVIPGATVTITNEATRTSQKMTSNATGDFGFTALMPGTYTVTVTSTGMQTWKMTGIVLNQNQSKTVPNIALKVGTAKQVVTVEGAFSPVPVSNGASSTTLNNTMVSQLSVQGRDAAELIKLMPAMAIASGISNTEWNSALTQINTGPIGAFSASGTQPNGGMQMIMNGSVITDAGNQGTQIANVNQDMTQEVTITNASFDAEHAHGPVTFSATGKSGTSSFHGTLYTYMRNGSLNSEDAFLKASGIPKPIDHYWYPGGNIGGPVLIPGTNFNKNRDKAFFFFGYEHMKQEPAGNLHKYVFPTAQMMQGNFSAAVLQPFAAGGGAPGYGGYASAVPCANSSAWNYGNACLGMVDGTGYYANGTPFPGPMITLYDANGNPISPATVDANHTAGVDTPAAGAMIDPSMIDPNGLGLLQMLQASRGVQMMNPATNDGFNGRFLDNHPVTSSNMNIRGDVNITDKMKAFVSFTRQPETDLNNIGVWWWAPAAPPYPSGMPAAQLSKAWSIGVTNTLSPTMVNEATFGYAYFINPVSLTSPSAVDPSTYNNYNVPLPPSFSQTNNIPQVPNMVTWCCGIEAGGGGDTQSATRGAGYSIPSFGAQWHGNGDFGKDSYTPDFSDNFTYIKGAHTMKFGFFWAAYANVQTENCCGGGTAGTWDFDTYGNTTIFNYYADMLVGHAQGYSVANTNFTDRTKYNEYDFYAQDSWKALPRLTINFGVRFEHEGQWFPFGPSTQGLMTWDPTNAANPYSATNTATLPGSIPGFVWHAVDNSIPLSGWRTHSLFPDPRVGVAWDMFGNGKTVLRGGFGIYRYQVSYNSVTQNGMLSAPFGMKTFTTSCNFYSLADLGNAAAVAAGTGSLNNGCGAPSAAAGTSGASFGGALLNDNRTPHTQTWNVMIDQRGPWNSTFEIQYQGNRSRDLLITGNGTNPNYLANINKIPIGGLFQPNPADGNTYYCQGAGAVAGTACDPNGPPSADTYRPYNYHVIDAYTHGGYANYNALILQWMKQAGPVVFNINYTWGHALGTWDSNSNDGPSAGPSIDAFCISCNYGTTAFNRAQIINASYVINLPKPVHQNRIAQGIVNGWQLSGDTQFQTGPPLQPLTGGNLNASYPAGVSNQSVLGTDSTNLQPQLVCNPGANLQSGQYFNPNCFRAPTIPTTNGPSVVGQNGPIIWPTTYGPGFFNSDLGLYKNFKITERQGLQFRVTAFNFLNHPLPQFNLGNDVNLQFQAQGGPNTNVDTTGKPRYKVGRRTVEFAIKYTF